MRRICRPDDWTERTRVPLVAVEQADKEWSEVEDVADDYGLSQVFPVVCPLSDKKPGIKEPRPLHYYRARFSQEEERLIQWRTRRDSAQAALARAAHGARSEQHASKRADREADEAAILARHQASEMERAAEIRERRGVGAIQLARARLEEVRLCLREAEEERRRRLEEQACLIAAEEEHTSKVEALLEVDRARVKAAKDAAVAAELESKARLAARDEEILRAKLEVMRHLEQARAAAKNRVEAAERRSVADLRAAEEQLESVRIRCADRRRVEEVRRNAAQPLLEQRHALAMERGVVDKASMRLFETSSKEHWDESVQSAAAREASTSERIDSNIGGAEGLIVSAGQKLEVAYRREEWARDSVRLAVDVLKRHRCEQKTLGRPDPVIASALLALEQASSKSF